MPLIKSSRHRKVPKKRRSFLHDHGIASAVLVFVSILFVLAVEWIQRGSMLGTLSWSLHNGKLFAVNALIDFCILLALYCLVGPLIPSIGIGSLLLLVFALINYFKTKLIGEPFFPWDVMLNKEGSSIIPLVTGPSAILRLGLGLAVVASIFLLRFRVPRLSLPWKSRLALGLVSVFALYSFGLGTAWAGQVLDRAGVSEIVWDQQQNYAANGSALAFTLNVKNAIVAKPAGYGENSISALAQTIGDQKAAAADPFHGKKPNVIFIMNEAFWDPTLLTNVSFSEDPLPTVHQLQQESTSGYLLSPQFGGGTSNVEFEVLTGNSMSALPSGSVPYQQYINKPLPSLASYFEDKGYKSLGIHSYEGWFWNRESVYKQLGFEGFMSKQYFQNPEYKGTFISDDEVSRNIIKEVDNTDRPMFIYAVTMQNHGPYDTPRYDSNPIQANGNLTAEAQSTLETYTHGAHDADQSLKMLLDHFKESDEPTVIVFYGDHLPMLGLGYDVYKQAGFIHTDNESDWTLEETEKMHSVPFVVWSNVSLPKQNVPALSDSFLGSFMLNSMNMDKPAPFAFNYELSQKIPGLLRNLVVDSDQGLYQKVPDSMKQDVDKYKELQYDSMFGQKYLANFVDHDYLTKAALPNYNEEFVDDLQAGAAGSPNAEPAQK